jgi:hypothetical protein
MSTAPTGASEKSKEAPKAKKAAPAPKKASLKKLAPKKAAAAGTKVVATKKGTKKVAAGKLSKKPVKAAKSAIKRVKAVKLGNVVKKVAKKAVSAAEFTRYERFVIDAINTNKVEGKPYVSLNKIKQYISDFMEKTKPALIPKLVKKAVQGLTDKKYLKAKKDSYTFAAKGKDLADRKVPARKKVVRPVKETAATKDADAPGPVKKAVVRSIGRTIRPVQL